MISTLESPSARLITTTVRTCAVALNDIWHCFKRNARNIYILLCQIWCSIAEIVRQVGFEVHSVRRFDAALRFVRLPRCSSKLCESTFVRRIQAQKIILVQLGHAQRELREGFSGLTHFR